MEEQAPKSYFRIRDDAEPVDPNDMCESVYGLYVQLLSVKNRKEVEEVCEKQTEFRVKYRYDSAKKQSLVFCQKWKTCHCKVAFRVKFSELNAAGRARIDGFATHHADDAEITRKPAMMTPHMKRKEEPVTEYSRFREAVLKEFKDFFETRFGIFEREFRDSITRELAVMKDKLFDLSTQVQSSRVIIDGMRNTVIPKQLKELQDREDDRIEMANERIDRLKDRLYDFEREFNREHRVMDEQRYGYPGRHYQRQQESIGKSNGSSRNRSSSRGRFD